VFDPYLSFRLRITTTACWPREAQGKRFDYRCFYALDVCAEFAQFFIKMFVAAVDMIDTTDLGYSVGFQACKHQRGRRARSLAITGAPRRPSTPSITAVAPSNSTCAPMRFSSATCM